MPAAVAEIERVIGHRLAREEKLVRALGRRRAATLDDVLPEVYDDVPKFMHVYARYSLLAHAHEAGRGGARAARRRASTAGAVSERPDSASAGGVGARGRASAA